MLLASSGTRISSIASTASLTVETYSADVLCAHDGRHGRKRQAGIETAAELRHERHPPQDAIGVRRGVEEAGRASRIGQNRQVADRVVRRVKNGVPLVSPGGSTIAIPIGCSTHVLGTSPFGSKVRP